ncbi:hypothetical protein HPP92_012729 [Vanilla planifolia]|uniref:Uncharacterized protein n=1 Tax=Vanilla planifolia TaxID=51239 RepID=A0A835QQC9_VANPL|nr:hypothetical protein HPP92_012729 [Vanilla planifolia]
MARSGAPEGPTMDLFPNPTSAKPTASEPCSSFSFRQNHRSYAPSWLDLVDPRTNGSRRTFLKRRKRVDADADADGQPKHELEPPPPNCIEDDGWMSTLADLALPFQNRPGSPPVRTCVLRSEEGILAPNAKEDLPPAPCVPANLHPNRVSTASREFSPSV